MCREDRELPGGAGSDFGIHPGPGTAEVHMTDGCISRVRSRHRNKKKMIQN